MKRYIGALMFVVAFIPTLMIIAEPDMAGPGERYIAGFMWLLVGIPGAILFFRSQKTKE